MRARLVEATISQPARPSRIGREPEPANDRRSTVSPIADRATTVTRRAIWGVTDASSWIPGVFKGEGYALIYDVNLNPKPAYTVLQQDLRLAAHGAPHRPQSSRS